MQLIVVVVHHIWESYNLLLSIFRLVNFYVEKFRKTVGPEYYERLGKKHSRSKHNPVAKQVRFGYTFLKLFKIIAGWKKWNVLCACGRLIFHLFWK